MFRFVLFLLLPLLATAATPDCTKTDGSAGDGIRCNCEKTSSVKETCLPYQTCNINSVLTRPDDCCSKCCRSTSCTCPNEPVLCVYPTCPVVDGSALFLGFTDANDDKKVKVRKCQCSGEVCSAGQTCTSTAAANKKCQYKTCPADGAVWLSMKDKGGVGDLYAPCQCSADTDCQIGWICKDSKCSRPICNPADGSAANTESIYKTVGCTCGAEIDGWQPTCSGDLNFCDASRANDAGSCRCAKDAKGDCGTGSGGGSGVGSNSTVGSSASKRFISSAVAVVAAVATSFVCCLMQ